MKSKKKLISNEWVRITATKSGQEGSLVINNEDPVKGMHPEGSQKALVLHEANYSLLSIAKLKHFLFILEDPSSLSASK